MLVWCIHTCLGKHTVSRCMLTLPACCILGTEGISSVVLGLNRERGRRVGADAGAGPVLHDASRCPGPVRHRTPHHALGIGAGRIGGERCRGKGRSRSDHEDAHKAVLDCGEARERVWESHSVREG